MSDLLNLTSVVMNNAPFNPQNVCTTMAQNCAMLQGSYNQISMIVGLGVFMMAVFVLLIVGMLRHENKKLKDKLEDQIKINSLKNVLDEEKKE